MDIDMKHRRRRSSSSNTNNRVYNPFAYRPSSCAAPPHEAVLLDESDSSHDLHPVEQPIASSSLCCETAATTIGCTPLTSSASHHPPTTATSYCVKVVTLMLVSVALVLLLQLQFRFPSSSFQQEQDTPAINISQQVVQQLQHENELQEEEIEKLKQQLHWHDTAMRDLQRQEQQQQQDQDWEHKPLQVKSLKEEQQEQAVDESATQQQQKQADWEYKPLEVLPSQEAGKDDKKQSKSSHAPEQNDPAQTGKSLHALNRGEKKLAQHNNHQNDGPTTLTTQKGEVDSAIISSSSQLLEETPLQERMESKSPKISKNNQEEKAKGRVINGQLRAVKRIVWDDQGNVQEMELKNTLENNDSGNQQQNYPGIHSPNENNVANNEAPQQ